MAGKKGRPERAARVFGAAGALLEALGARMDPVDQGEYDRNVSAMRAQLDEAAFAAAWAEGRTMALEQAIAYAGQETPCPTCPPHRRDSPQEGPV